jgi:hypothetical protein
MFNNSWTSLIWGSFDKQLTTTDNSPPIDAGAGHAGQSPGLGQFFEEELTAVTWEVHPDCDIASPPIHI